MNSSYSLKAALVVAVASAAMGLASTATAAPAAAPATNGEARSCFLSGNVSGFAAADDRTVNLRVGAGDIYTLMLFSPSPDIKWTEGIGLESRGSSWICSGLDATIIVPSTIGPRRYPVVSVRKLTAAEAAALPAKARP